MKSLKKIKSQITKNNIIFNPGSIICTLYGDFYNNCQSLNKLATLYMYDVNQMMNKYNQLLHKIYDNPIFIDSLKEYNKKLTLYKEILNEFNNQLYFKSMPLFVKDINSFFYIQRQIMSSYEEIFLTIQYKTWNYKYLYFDIDKKYTNIINYLGFLNKFQYDILNNNNTILSDYLFYRIKIHPQYLDKNDLQNQLYAIITDFINESHNCTINDIKEHWLLPEFTNKDEKYFNFCLAKKLLKKL